MGKEFPLLKARRGYGERRRERKGWGGSFICKNGRGYVGIGTAAERREYFIKGAQGWGEYPTPRVHITI